MNQLVVPVGVPVHFSLTSASVMNAFFIPQLGSMIYTMNGMRTQLNLRADEPGTFRGLSSHYSGNGFSDMHFDVQAVPAPQFAAWVEPRATRARPWTPGANRPGQAKREPRHSPIVPSIPTCSRDRHAEAAAGPGPQAGRPKPGVSPTDRA